MAVDAMRGAVLASLDERRLLRLAQDLIRLDTDSPPGNEQVIADFLATYLGAAGLEAQVQVVQPGRANVLARLGRAGERPHLILNGHTDTVPAGPGWTFEPHGGQTHDGRLYGRGASDMKGGLAAMIAAVEALVRSGAPLRGSLTIAGVMDEEEGQTGTRHAVEHGLHGDFAIVGEPTELLPVIAHKGDMYIEIVARGVEAHASTPEAGVNAIEQMAEVIVELRALAEALRLRSHHLVGHPTLTVGTIAGGITTCMVPGTCRVTIDRRVLPGEQAAEVVDEVRAVVERVRARRQDLRAEVRMIGFAPPMEIAAGTPVVEAVRAATAEVVGRDPGVHGWSAACDANILVGDAATPTVVFGPGSIAQQAHRPNESVSIDELVAAAKIYALTILRLLR
jgi:succinyl-diaminopimelate desuccinylase